MLPPGPRGGWIFGSLFDYKGPKSNLEWTKEYGAIYFVKMGPKNMVYLNSIDLVKKHMEGKKGEVFLNRPGGPAAIGQGLLFGSGDRWQKNKSAFVKSLNTKNFTKTMELSIQRELELVVKELSARCDRSLKIGDVLIVACANVIAGLLLGEPLPVGGEDRKELLGIVNNLERTDLTSLVSQISLKFPILRAPLSRISGREIIDIPGTSHRLHALIRKWIKSLDTSGPPAYSEPTTSTDDVKDNTKPMNSSGDTRTGLLEDQWALHEEPLEDNQKSTLQIILEQQEFADAAQKDNELIQSVTDMFFGGVTSTLSGLEFTLMYLSKHPAIRQAAQSQLDRAAAAEAHGGQITWSMREQLPYLQACIAEGLRLGSVTPSSLPHVAIEDVEVEGYTVPKGTSVMGSIYSLHRDPNFYTDPEVFKPDRHIDSNGLFQAPESYRPFGIGARRCVGEVMAEMQLFLYIATILRHFDITAVDDVAPGDMETHMVVVHRLKAFTCLLKQRKVTGV
ncbi:unnamed protein product [Lymnaea stagnalis]|uniref:Cytochrome P450 n=1 Tax=Lymnaea stagnalis TaxID=6523 RepID=A0AAV2HC89_LYMST